LNAGATADRRNVLILGYGEMGHAMEFLLTDRVRLSIWEKYPPPGFQSAELAQAAPEADVVIFCLPVVAHREVAQEVLSLLRPDTICVSIAKGLDEQGRTAPQIFDEILCEQRRAFLYGPMISEEIRDGRYAFAQIGCSHRSDYAVLQAVFAGSHLILEHSDDIPGISWAVILKNVYALLFGMADELKLGDNVRGYLAVAALKELDAIVMRMGGHAGTAYALAGLGDLITTATSEDSHHHELGRRLARGETDDISGEGVHTLKMVEQFKFLPVQDYPLFRLVTELLQAPATIAERLRAGAYIQMVS
jgi:glycerol-3-phosphate dehydrogenase (NAD(P)+)